MSSTTALGATTGGGRHAHHRRLRPGSAGWRTWLAWLGFLAPALIVYGVFVLYPLVQSVSYSMFDWAGPGRAATAVGFGNYAELLSDPVFYKALGNTVFVIVTSLAIQLPSGLILALIITGPIRARRVWRAVYFIPNLMSTVAIGILWGYVYNPDFGVINVVLRTVGLGGLAQGWLGQGATALPAVMVTTIWQWAPFYMIIYAAALSGFPHELYEASAIDGANKWQQFWRVTLPMLKPTVITTCVLSLIGSVKAFDLIYVMTKGGPNDSTELLATYMFEQGFTNYRFGYASTIAVAMFAISLILTVIVLARNGRAGKPKEA